MNPDYEGNLVPIEVKKNTMFQCDAEITNCNTQFGITPINGEINFFCTEGKGCPHSKEVTHFVFFTK